MHKQSEHFARNWFRFVSGLILIGLFASPFCTNCQGQGVLLPDDDSFRIPRHRPRVPEQSYRIRELSVDASIKEQIATTQVTQVFENISSRQIQASFVFPIPYEGAVSQMTFLVDGKEYEAKMLKADEARQIYEGYVSRNQDPALLEWVGQGMFKTSVFPIPPGATRTVTLKYSQLLRKQDRMTDYLFPLATARYTCRPLEKLSIRIAIEAKAKIGNLYSPSHLVDIKRDDELHAVVTHSTNGQTPNSDFRLMFDTAREKLEVSLLSHWPKEDDAGYFLLLASPELKPADGEPLKKTVMFVVDRSGSMSGPKIDQAREAAKFIVNNLKENDLFNLISYDTAINEMSPELLRMETESRQKAIGFVNSINAGGMTNIHDSLTKAFSMIQNDATPTFVVFLTDGLPTAGEINELKIASATRIANRHGARLINFGVGYDVNSRLLDRLARENNGQSEYVRPDENIEAAVARLYSKISSPVLSKVKMNYNFANLQPAEGQPVDRLYPANVSDFFAGGQIVILGRYRKSGPMKLEINGNVGSKEEKFQFDANLANKGNASDLKYIAQLWAYRRIGEIIDLIDLNGKNDELINELVDLSKKYGIVTPYTSYLADDRAQVAGLMDRGGQVVQLSRNLKQLEDTEGMTAFFGRAEKQSMMRVESLAERGSYPASPMFESRAAGGRGAGGRGSVGGGSVGGGLGGELGGGGGRGDGNMASNKAEGMRHVGAVTVYVRGKILVADNASDVDIENDKTIVGVKRFSPEYFQLVKENTRDENLILTEQRDEETLIVSLRGKVYRIE